MNRSPFLCALVWGLFLTGCASSASAQREKTSLAFNCPVTRLGDPLFAPAAPFSPTAPYENEFWFGSENLWTAVPDHGIWSGLPLNAEGYTQKIFWWSKYFSLKEEPEPDLIVSGRRLDQEAPALIVSKATNASASDIGSTMLIGVDFPSSGCWEITGRYKKSELTFVVWVEP